MTHLSEERIAEIREHGMSLSDFTVGLEFWMSGFPWRCTDVGSRLVIAIQLNHDHEPEWYSGPPYAVAERSLDEYDLMACSLREGEGNSYPKELNKSGRDAMTGFGFRIYEERFRPQVVFLELAGFPIGLDIKMDNLKSSVTARFPLAWAHKVGIVDQEYVARQVQSIIDRKTRTPMLVKELEGKTDTGVQTDEEC
jgi:hypothetical protein